MCIFIKKMGLYNNNLLVEVNKVRISLYLVHMTIKVLKLVHGTLVLFTVVVSYICQVLCDW